MRYIIVLLALIPLMFMGILFLYGSGIVWFDELVVWGENAFSSSLPVVKNKLYFFSKIAGISALMAPYPRFLGSASAYLHPI
jgi:hypothetical protein